MRVWDNFLYKNQKKGKALAYYLSRNRLTYKVKFNWTELNYAEISPTTPSQKWYHKGAINLFDKITSFPLIQVDNEGRKLSGTEPLRFINASICELVALVCPQDAAI